MHGSLREGPAKGVFQDPDSAYSVHVLTQAPLEKMGPWNISDGSAQLV